MRRDFVRSEMEVQKLSIGMSCYIIQIVFRHAAHMVKNLLMTCGQ
jgi:hypothetical protein